MNLELLAKQVEAAYNEWASTVYIDELVPTAIGIENNRSRHIKWQVYVRLRDQYDQQVELIKKHARGFTNQVHHRQGGAGVVSG